MENSHSSACRPVSVDAAEKPECAGRYNVMVEGMRTFLPLFLEFDGTAWVDLARFKREHFNLPVFWFRPE